MPDWFDKQTLGDLLNQAADRFGPREALMYEGQRWTFDEFREETDRVARALINLGIQPGDKVSIWMPNRAEWLFLFGAVAKIGAILVPINTRFRTQDMEYLVNHSDSAALILMDRSGRGDYLDMLREVAPEIDSGDPSALRPAAFPALRNVIIVGDERPTGTLSWDAMLAGADEVPASELAQREAAVNLDQFVVPMRCQCMFDGRGRILASALSQGEARVLADQRGRLVKFVRRFFPHLPQLVQAFFAVEASVASYASGMQALGEDMPAQTAALCFLEHLVAVQHRQQLFQFIPVFEIDIDLFQQAHQGGVVQHRLAQAVDRFQGLFGLTAALQQVGAHDTRRRARLGITPLGGFQASGPKLGLFELVRRECGAQVVDGARLALTVALH